MASKTIRGAFGAFLIWDGIAQSGIVQRRLLSTTAPRQSTHIITFDKTSSPELDSLLHTIREEIILPHYIPHEQRQRLHRLKYEQRLASDPITLEIDGEVRRYRYRNPQTSGLPKTRSAFKSALEQMRTREDFENLPQLYMGLVSVANRKLQPFDRARMVRRAGEYGFIDIPLRMAWNAKTWRFMLDEPEVVAHLLLGIFRGAVNAGWEREATEKALLQAEHVLELLESEIHQSTAQAKEVAHVRNFPFFRDPQFLGMRLSLAAAAVAVRHNEGQDVDGKVAKYAKQLVALWPEGKGLKELHQPEAHAKNGMMWFMRDHNQLLLHASPIVHGLELAARVVDPETAKGLEKIADVLKAEMAPSLEAVQEGKPGLELYNQLKK